MQENKIKLSKSEEQHWLQEPKQTESKTQCTRDAQAISWAALAWGPATFLAQAHASGCGNVMFWLLPHPLLEDEFGVMGGRGACPHLPPQVQMFCL